MSWLELSGKRLSDMSQEQTCHTCKGTGTIPSNVMIVHMFVKEYGQWQDRPFYDLKKGMPFTLVDVKDPKGYGSKEGTVVWYAAGDAFFYPERVEQNGKWMRKRAVLDGHLLIVPERFAVEIGDDPGL